MTHLADSDWVVDYLAGRTEAIRLLDTLVINGLGVSVLTIYEISEGIFSSRDPITAETGFRAFLRRVVVYELNESISWRAGRIRGHLRKTGQMIDEPDILIAATAIHHNLTVVTRNLNHYNRIPTLRLYSGSI